jgi:hypothetical protein
LPVPDLEKPASRLDVEVVAVFGGDGWLLVLYWQELG